MIPREYHCINAFVFGIFMLLIKVIDAIIPTTATPVPIDGLTAPTYNQPYPGYQPLPPQFHIPPPPPPNIPFTLEGFLQHREYQQKYGAVQQQYENYKKTQAKSGTNHPPYPYPPPYGPYHPEYEPEGYGPNPPMTPYNNHHPPPHHTRFNHYGPDHYQPTQPPYPQHYDHHQKPSEHQHTQQNSFYYTGGVPHYQPPHHIPPNAKQYQNAVHQSYQQPQAHQPSTFQSVQNSPSVPVEHKNVEIAKPNQHPYVPNQTNVHQNNYDLHQQPPLHQHANMEAKYKQQPNNLSHSDKTSSFRHNDPHTLYQEISLDTPKQPSNNINHLKGSLPEPSIHRLSNHLQPKSAEAIMAVPSEIHSSTTIPITTPEPPSQKSKIPKSIVDYIKQPRSNTKGLLLALQKYLIQLTKVQNDAKQKSVAGSTKQLLPVKP